MKMLALARIPRTDKAKEVSCDLCRVAFEELAKVFNSQVKGAAMLSIVSLSLSE